MRPRGVASVYMLHIVVYVGTCVQNHLIDMIKFDTHAHTYAHGHSYMSELEREHTIPSHT